MPVHTNEDGLQERYGISRAAVAVDGLEAAEERVLEFLVEDATALGDADTATVAGDRPVHPCWCYCPRSTLHR